MDKVLRLLPFWLALTAPLSAQEATAAQHATSKSLLARVLRGQMAGPEETLAGPAEGRCAFEPILEGAWVRWNHSATLDGRLFEAAEQLFQVRPDGEIHAYRFGLDGRYSAWRGRIDPRGAVLKTFDARGNLLGMQVFQWDQGGFELTVLERRGPEEDLVRTLAGRYASTLDRPPLRATEAAWERGRSLPYARYLGRFEGDEQSDQGASRSTIETMPILDGSWYRSAYESLQEGRRIHAGIGFIRCAEDGSYVVHWFDPDGRHGRIDGKLDADGALAWTRDSIGVETVRHTDRVTEDGYRYTVETRAGAEQPWTKVFEAEYRRSESEGRR